LRGVRDCPQGKSDTREAYCGSSRHFEWTVTWNGPDLERILAKSLPQVLGKSVEVGQVKDIRVKGKYRCGRVKKLEVRTTRGTYRVGGDRIRWVLRLPGKGSALWSTKFDLKVRRSRGRIKEVIASGRGFGHGVGMCQEGAIQMAKEGKHFDQILKHYYPGTRLQKILYEPIS
jgi:stage II sporulation protein D